MRKWMVALVLLVMGGGLGWFFLMKLGYWARPWGEYECPMEKRFCRKAEVVSLGGEYFGLGFDLPVGKELFSLVDAESVKVGTVTVGQKIDEVGNYRYKKLEGHKGGMIYYLGKGEVPEVEKLKRGEVLDKVREGKLDYFGNYNLIVAWLDGNGGKIEVYPEDIK